MAKAKPKATTAWIRLGRAIDLAGEYLGDPEVAEREIRKGLATGEIPWWYVRFEAPPLYSGPGLGDPEFWKFDGQECTRDGSVEIRTWREIHIKGDSVTRTDYAAAYGIELDRDALVRLKLLPPDAPLAASSTPKGGKAWQVNRVLQAIPECFPNGDIDEIPDPGVRQKVGTYLESETKDKGRKVPDRKTMNRAIRQYRNRPR